MKNSFINKLDYIFVLRPMLFFPGWASLLAGYFIADKTELFYTWSQIAAIDLSLIALLLILFAVAMGASFLLNQLKDIESDLENEKLFIISGGYLTKSKIISEIVLLIFVSLIIAQQISFSVLVLSAGFIFLTGYLYNFKPFAFKDLPIASLVANSLMGWFAFAIGWAAKNELSWLVLTDALPYLFFNTALYFYTTLPDVVGDRKSGKNTIAVLYGEKLTIRLAFILFLSSLFTAIYLKDLMILLVLVLAAPFFIMTIRNYSIHSTVRATKFAILFFAMVICFKLPFFFILMVLGFYLTRWYFKKRFNFNYPNFKG